MNLCQRVITLIALTGVGAAVWTPTVGRAGEPIPEPRFREIAQAAGVTFTHEPGATGAFRLPEIIGSGVALLDYDGDGALDVFLVQGSPGARTSSRLFRNELQAGTGAASRALRFVDVTDRAGVAQRGWGMGAPTGDYDNDGDVDLYVTSFGANVLYRNDGNGTFSDATTVAGVGDTRWSTSAAFVDYDADGDLDLFVAAYVDFTEKGNKPCYEPGGRETIACRRSSARCRPGSFGTRGAAGSPTSPGRAASDRLQAPGSAWSRLTSIAMASSICMWRTMAHPITLWINRGDGTFAEQGLMSGVAYDAAGNALAGMGAAAGDVDGDGDEDLFVTNLVGETHTLYLNDGRGQFEDATIKLGLPAVSRPFTGFGTDFFDVDRDGWLDLFIANGAVAIVDARRRLPFPYQQRNLLLLNTGGRRFRDASAVAGPALALEEVSRGAAFGDLDNDGDVDIVVSNNHGPVRLLLNETPGSSHWLSVRLEGTSAVRDGQGAVVEVLRNGAPALRRRAHTDGSYLSASDPRVHIGLGSLGAIAGLAVEWRKGERETWPAMPIDRQITLRQGTGRRQVVPQ